MNLDTELSPFTKINSKWTTDRNAKHNTLKVLDHLGGNLSDLMYGNDF